jgi:alpha-beta hydrolase superfamily lysophospholipase
MDFSELQSQLKPLTFSIEQDAELTAPELQEYLQYYSIDFSKQFEATHRMGSVSAAGFEIATHYWLSNPARGTVHIIHDHFDHVGLCGPIIQWCLQEHYNVVAIDLPGHGLSTGPRASIKSFDQYGEVLETLTTLSKSNLPGRNYCIAHGVGAAAVMNLMWKHGKRPFAKMVFLAPLVRPHYWPKAKFRYYLARLLGKTIKRKLLDNSREEEFVDFVNTSDSLQCWRIPVKWITAMKRWQAALPSMPTEILGPLIVQGKQDGLMDWQYNVDQVKAHFPNAITAYLRAAHHHLPNEEQRTRLAIFGKLKQYFDQ